ncbi:MAG: PD40 domain-containing protein, partial [Bdellovibrio sp.]|nr:PD40 domain-containing protein [Bdellovibrio sp.]
MSKLRVGINGFGRIGRVLFREGFEKFDIVGINSLDSIEGDAHLLKYDSAHGVFPAEVSSEGHNLIVNGKKIRTFPGNAPRTLSLAFSPDGNKLLSGGGDRLIRIWDVSSGRETKSLSGYTKVIKSLAFNKQGTILASALSDKEGNNIRTWDIVSGKDPGTLLAPLIQVESITYTQDGATIAAGGTALDNKSIALWNAQTNKLGTLLQADENSVRNITFSPDGKRIASATTDSILQIWDVAQKKVVQQLRGHRRTINNVKFSPDGKMLASAS